MQGYADRDLPARPVQRIATYVVAPTALASSFQSSLAEESAKRGVSAEDAYALLPPTRTYTDTEIGTEPGQKHREQTRTERARHDENHQYFRG